MPDRSFFSIDERLLEISSLCSRSPIFQLLNPKPMMKKKLLSLTTLAVLLAASAFGQVWTNVLDDNNFSDFGNWIANTSNPPTSWAGDSSNSWQINLAGDDRAILGAVIVTGLDRNLILGGIANATGAMEINGGTLGINRNLRVGHQPDSTATLTMTSGSLTTGRSTYIGQSNAFGAFNLSGGTVDFATTGGSEELGVAHQLNATGVLNISGSGTLNVAAAARGAWIAEGNESNATVSISDGGSLNVGSNARIAEGVGSNATVNISDSGSLNVGSSARVGFGENSNTALNISGGSMNASTGFIGFAGLGANATVTVSMTGGEINADRMGFADNATATATLNMTGGVINLEQNGGTASHSGGLRMQSAGAALNFGGDARVNAQKLYINDGGLITLGGDALIDISGSRDGTNFTFDFSSAFLGLSRGEEQPDWSWTDVGGEIKFSSLGASLIVAGSEETFNIGSVEDPNNVSVSFLSLFNEAIANGVFSTNTPFLFDTGYDADGDFTFATLVIPEPSTSALIFGIGTLLVVIGRRKGMAAREFVRGV
jgi:hypothetical protein